MKLSAKQTENKTFAPAPAGSHVATCISVIDLGTQQTEYNGETKKQRKVMIQFELSEDAGLRDDGKRFIVSKRYTASLHEKSALRKDLISWRGRDFSAEELNEFELNNIAGKTCMVAVTHAVTPNGTYANVSSIMGAPKGVSNQPQADVVTFSFDEFNEMTLLSLPEWIQAIIGKSPEYLSATNGSPATADQDEAF